MRYVVFLVLNPDSSVISGESEPVLNSFIESHMYQRVQIEAAPGLTRALYLTVEQTLSLLQETVGCEVTLQAEKS